MVELNSGSIPAKASGVITDDDLVLIYEVSAASQNSGKATRGAFLHDVVRQEGDATLGTLTVEVSVAAPEGAIDDLEVNNLSMGATVSRFLAATASIAIPTVAAGAQGSVTMAVTGALVGDMVLIELPAALPVGLVCKGIVTAPDVVTVYALNTSGSSIAGASYSARALLIRAA